MKLFKRYIGLLLLLLFMGYIVPRELVHDLVHHQDTHDHVSSIGGDVRIDNSHQHCDVLKLQGVPFALSFLSPDLSSKAVRFFYRLPADPVFTPCFYQTADLRGPPCCLA